MGVLNEATIGSVLLAALEQFEDQATDMLQLLSVSEECEESGTTQTIVKKTPSKILPSALCKHAPYVKMYYLHFCCSG